MLGDRLKEIAQNDFEQNIQKYESLDAKEKRKVDEKIVKVRKIINGIIVGTNAIADNKKKAVINKKGDFKVTDMPEIFGGEEYGDWIQSRGEKEFFEFFKASKLPLDNEFKTLLDWMILSGIKQVYIQFEHCGTGMRSWNSYWVVPK